MMIIFLGRSNETAILENPFKTRSFFDMSKPSHGFYAYTFDIPMMFMSLLIITPMTVQIVIIISICIQMDGLNYRIVNMSSYDNINIFKEYIKKHCHIISFVDFFFIFLMNYKYFSL